MTHRTLPLLAAAGALLVPAAAQADATLPGTAGAAEVAGLSGYAVWSQPDGDAFRLVVRKPDGTTSTPAVGAFATPPVVHLGTNALTGAKRLVAVYSRTGADGDADGVSLDLATGKETPIPGFASRTYDETQVAVSGGSYVVVRRGGPKAGLVYRGSRAGSPVRRLTTTVPREIAWGGGRVWTLERRDGKLRLVVRRPSGEGRALTRAVPADASSLNATRYRAVFLAEGTAFATNRIGGSGPAATGITARAGDRALPAGTTSIGIATNSGEAGWATTAQGVVQLVPRVRFFS